MRMKADVDASALFTVDDLDTVRRKMSAQSRDMAEFFGSVRDRVNQSQLDLQTVRDVFEASAQAAGTEPEGVTYAEVDADGVAALWCIPPNCAEDCVILFNHAGGSVVFSMRSDRKAAGHLAKSAGMRVLVVDFRLSPENKFPAQRDDVDTAYRWLLSEGYKPEKIASCGHSIGGNLAVNHAIRLRDQGRPLPGALLAVSTWCDLELSNETIETNAAYDRMLSMNRLEFFRRSWLGDTDISPTDPQVNLLHADLKGLPPLNIYYGTDEILVGEIVEFANRAVTAGVDVSLRDIPGGQHLWLLTAGRVPETDTAINEIGQWLRSRLTSPAMGTGARTPSDIEIPTK